MNRFMKQIGQGMTEYIIIVALIAIAGIGAFTFFSDGMKEQIGNVTNELTGGTATITAAAEDDAAMKQGSTMADYGGAN